MLQARTLDERQVQATIWIGGGDREVSTVVEQYFSTTVFAFGASNEER